MKFPLSSVLFCLLVSATPLQGAQLTFRPKIVDYFGNLEIESLYEKDERKTGGREQKVSNASIREFLELGLHGYSYHPRFLIFFLRLSAGLEQERFKAENTDSSWDIGSAEEFELRATFLPKHPYNLEMFTLQKEPLLAGNYVTGGSSEVRESGAILRYKKQPWKGRLSYTFQELESDLRTRETDYYRANLGFFKGFFGLHGGYFYSDSTATDGESITRENYFVNNTLYHGRSELTSIWEVDEEDEYFDSSIQNQWKRKWEERLSADLPWNFHTSLSSIQTKETNQTTSTAPGTVSAERFFDSSRYHFLLNHRLYRSLTTRAILQQTETESSGGDTEVRSYQLSANYQKRLYGGNSFTGRLFTGESAVEQTGTRPFIEEPQNASSLGIITLDHELIDPNTIDITIVDFTDPTLRTTLVEGVHYTVHDFGSFLEIRLGPVLPSPFDLVFVEQYEYLVTYSLEEARFELATDTWGYSLGLHLFASTVYPYYYYTSISQELRAGTLPNPPDEVDIHLIGLQYTRDPVRFGIEHQRTESILYPERHWNYFAEYRRDLPPSAEIFLRLEREETKYLQGAGRPDDFSERTENLTTAIATLSTRNLLRGLSASITGTYSHLDGLTDADRYSARTALRWNISKSFVELKSHYNYSRSKSTPGRRELTTTEEILLLFRLVRKLF